MNKKAFSLVELLVVVAIIGILSVILVPNVQENMKRAKVAKTRALIGSLEAAVVTFHSDSGKYPTSFDPGLFYIDLTEKAKSTYEPDSSEIRKYDRSGATYWENLKGDDSLSQILQKAGVPSQALTAKEEDSYVFIDAWDSPLYFISHEVYNKTGKVDYRRAASQNNTNKDALSYPCAYEMKEGKRYKPYKPTSFQIISFGPDGKTVEDPSSTDNGGLGSLIGTDKIDNDGDEYIDHLDQVRPGDREDGSDTAEDDITNFM